MSEGYYIDKYTWSIEKYRGQWIMRARLAQDKLATSPNQLEGIKMWCISNKSKFYVCQE